LALYQGKSGNCSADALHRRRGKSGHSPGFILGSRVAGNARRGETQEVRAETFYFERNKISPSRGISSYSNIRGETAKSLPECKAVLRRYVGGCRLTPTVTPELDK